jgi:hypothetical protein
MRIAELEFRLKIIPQFSRFRNGKSNKTKEVAMTSVASFRNFEFETTCPKCGETLIAPEWSECVSERLVVNLWSCSNVSGMSFHVRPPATIGS